MKSSRGITVLALLITVVVIVIITSITVYTGVNMLADARQKEASDKLKVICNEIRKNDNFLSLDDSVFDFDKEDLEALDLGEYFDEDYPIQFEKTTSTIDDNSERTIYRLKMYKGTDRTSPYAEEYFMIANKLEKNTYSAEFDKLKGVNKPILYENMYALATDGNSIVEDVYEDNWYDYLSVAPSFAKMQYGSGDDNHGVYVWIPRYAYFIQNYYDGAENPDRSYGEVPSSAIKIVFLKETTNYMANDELMPVGFKVHPAFSNNNGEFSGIWVAIDPSTTEETLSKAVSATNSLVLNSGKENTHLMTNSEFASALYLMYAYDCTDQINFSNREFVAATIKNKSSALNDSDFCDIYELSEERTNGLEEKLGDAMLETNWERLDSSTYMTSEEPCLIRVVNGDKYFDFKAIAGTTEKAHYRTVITP